MKKKPRPIRLADYTPPRHRISTVSLDVALDPQRTRVSSRLAVTPAKDDGDGALHLNGEALELESLAINGKPLAPEGYETRSTGIVVHDAPQRPFELECVTWVDPEANTELQGLYRSRGVYCTQCEAQGFRRITYFPDRPDVLATYEVRLEARLDEAPVLLSNGNPGEKGKLPGGRHFAIWRDPFPKPSYLFALVGGALSPVRSTFKTASGRNVRLAIYVEPGKEDRATWAMDSLKRSMRWDERRFGREYDLDVFNIVAVSDFNMGAMENKGLNIFNDRLILASPETATDSMFEAIESVVAHEYFHNWTGNRITCRDWFQLCLKEGLTVFRDQEFTGDERSAAVQRIGDVRALKASQFPEDAGPLAHPVRPESYIEINNFYTATVYEKGAELVRMIRVIVGDRDFRAGMDLYFDRHDGEAATVEDFVRCFEEASGHDLGQFRLWYSQARTPELAISLDYDETARVAELSLEQTLRPAPGANKAPKPMHIPVGLALLGSNGNSFDLTPAKGDPIIGNVVHLRESRKKLRFTGITSKPVISALRGFSAPVNLVMEQSDSDLEFLLAHDSDPFNRWQAANRLATRTLIALVEALKAGMRPRLEAALSRALATVVDDASLDAAYRAELLRLPTQADIAREIGRDVDPDIILKAHRLLSRRLGAALGPKLEALYVELRSAAPYSPSAGDAGRRALRNACLTLLTARGGATDVERLSTHYFGAENMTEAAHGLMLSVWGPRALRASVLTHFYDRWHGDALVLDTWFAAQAQAPVATALQTVKRLTKHPAYSATTPNKVRALIGTFAFSNAVGFNRPDGKGYEFVANQVLEIDRFNPQVAARMLGSFRSWHALEAGRRKAARKALAGIVKARDLSPDVFEIATKMMSSEA